MELRRAADALLRSQASPLASILNPSTTVRWAPSRQLVYICSPNRQTRRNLTITTKMNALRPQATTSAAPPPPPSELSDQEAQFKPTPPSSNSLPKQEETIESLTSSLGWTKPSSRPAPRTFQPPAWADAARSTSREARLNGGSSASDLMRTLQQKRAGSRHPSSSSDFDLSRMDVPSPPAADPLSSMSMMSDIERETRIPKPIRIPIKLNPSTGRSVSVGAGIDVGRGFRLLEQSCARNKVRRDATAQRFHERGGLKRKRLRRERWRRKFLEGFKATVGRVKQLKNQGW